MMAATVPHGRVIEDFSGQIPAVQKIRTEISIDANSMYSIQFTSTGNLMRSFTMSTVLNRKRNENDPRATPALFAAPPMITITHIQNVHSYLVQVSEPTEP